MPDPPLIRAAIALVWLYEGLWRKVLGRAPHQESVAVLRSFAEPEQHQAANAAARDRSILWGSVGIRPVLTTLFTIAPASYWSFTRNAWNR